MECEQTGHIIISTRKAYIVNAHLPYSTKFLREKILAVGIQSAKVLSTNVTYLERPFKPLAK